MGTDPACRGTREHRWADTRAGQPQSWPQSVGIGPNSYPHDSGEHATEREHGRRNPGQESLSLCFQYVLGIREEVRLDLTGQDEGDDCDDDGHADQHGGQYPEAATTTHDAEHRRASRPRRVTKGG